MKVISVKMKGSPLNLLLKYSSSSTAFTFLLLSLCLVQFCHCYSDTNSRQQQRQQRGNDNYYNSYPSSQNFSARDASVGYSSSSGSSLPSLPKPGAFVAYHRSLHNTSWAITIPLFTFLLPTANVGDPVNIGNQALYGFFAAVITIIGYAVPILFNSQIPNDINARSLEANNKITLSHLMHPGHLMNLVGLNIGNQIGVDPMKCLQKTVCEANRSPQNERYGMLAYPLQYFFPAKNVSASEAGARSIYELAARDGKFTKTDCKKKYECMFDVLDLATYCLSVYKRSRKRVKAEEEESHSPNKFYYPENNGLNGILGDKTFFR